MNLTRDQNDFQREVRIIVHTHNRFFLLSSRIRSCINEYFFTCWSADVKYLNLNKRFY